MHKQVAFPWDPSESFGAACSQPSLLANVSALLAAWRPGAEGGPALFNLLGGAVNPSGRLSVAWPRSVGGIGSQVPYLQQFALHYREQYQDEPTTPLFRFGAKARFACPLYLANAISTSITTVVAKPTVCC